MSRTLSAHPLYELNLLTLRLCHLVLLRLGWSLGIFSVIYFFSGTLRSVGPTVPDFEVLSPNPGSTPRQRVPPVPLHLPP